MGRQGALSKFANLNRELDPHFLKLKGEMSVREWIGLYEEVNGACWRSTCVSYGWPCVPTTDNGLGDGQARERAQWCDENVGRNNFAFMLAAYFFTHEVDAIAFKLYFAERL